MATFSNINTSDNLFLVQKINKIEDSKSDSYIFRKHINYSLTNSFIHKEIPTLSSIVSPVKQNLKSQAEELMKLQTEVLSLEDKVKELEISKKNKIVKVSVYLIQIEDLRKIIQRIADEDNFDCVFRTRSVIKNNPKEKSSSCSSSRSNKENHRVRSEITSLSTQESSETMAEEGEADGLKGITSGCSPCRYCYQVRKHDCLFMHSEMHQSLLYWQEHLSAPKRLFKA